MVCSFKKIFFLVLVFATNLSLIFAQPVTCFAKEEKGKWGVATQIEVYRKGSLEKEDKWVHKPQWQKVEPDKGRYGCLSGYTCDGFITFKNGLYGYAFCDGTKWENEFEKLDLSRHVVKKKGFWGAYNSDVMLLPFEYDTLYYLPNTRLYPEQYDTLYFYFIGNKGDKWSVLLAKQRRRTTSVVVTPVGAVHDNAIPYENGVVVASKNQWRFVDLRVASKPSLSLPYDSVKELATMFGVKKDGKWSLVNTSNTNRTVGKGWDAIDNTEVDEYFAVWAGSKVGVVHVENNSIKEVFEPRGSSVKVYWKKEGELVFLFDENGAKKTYDLYGKLLSTTGDVTVKSGRVEGPFNIQTYDEYGYRSVYDNATNEVIIAKDKVYVQYSNDPVMGHVLYIETGRGSHGLYQYHTKTFIKPIYSQKLEHFGQAILISKRTGEKTFVLLDRSSLQELALPFKVTDYKNDLQQLMKDDKGQWHEIDNGYSLIPASRVIRARNSPLPGIVTEETEDNKVRLIKLNDKQCNEDIQKTEWTANDKVLRITSPVKATEYFEGNGKTQTCNYTIPVGYSINQKSKPAEPLFGESFSVPYALADSGGNFITVNMYTNKVIRLPFKVVSDGVQYNGQLIGGTGFDICSFYSPQQLQLCGQRSRICSVCDHGYVTKTVKETIKGETTYKSVKTTTNESHLETQWDPKTNSNKWVKTTKPVTSYDMVKTTAPDRIEEHVVRQKCDKCKGTGRIYSGVSLKWNGFTLTQE